jgi:PAS domain S-box-containing protein
LSEAALPPNEAQRIAALRALHILDTPREERFDRITRLAQRLFDVPIALITLVDANRQWFKSCLGLDVDRTSRSVSFCAHAILHNDALIIPDARLDERFADNPLVTGDPGIRFYAGQPLVGPNDQKLGTLCIIDRRPRQMGAEDLEALRELATLAENELNVVRLSQALVIQRESEARVRAVVDNVADGIITYDEHGTIESFNRAAQRLFGYDALKAIGRNVRVLAPASGTPPPDQQGPRQSGDTFAVPGECRRVMGRREDGTTFPMELTVSKIGFENQPLFVAIVRDIAERKRAEEAQSRLASLVQHSNDAIDSKTLDGTIVSMNPSAEKLYGYSEEELKGEHISVLTPPSSRTR